MENYSQQSQTQTSARPYQVEYIPPGFAPLSPGNNNQPLAAVETVPQSREAIAATGIAKFLGLDPRIALIAIVLDTMLFGGEIVTFGGSVVISVMVGIVFGIITYKAQKSWYGDDHDSSLIKGLIMGLLTAIPTPIPAFLYVPAGFAGLVHLIRRKKR
jgi:hypothetical protein